MKNLLILALFLNVISAGLSEGDALNGALRIERSFHRPVEFQFFREDAVVWLRTIMKSGMLGFDKGDVVRDDRRSLSSADSEQLVKLVDTVLVSKMKYSEIPGYDGSYWYLTIKSPSEMNIRLVSP